MHSSPEFADFPELTAAAKTWPWLPPMDCLAGKNILVTGAGSGIGNTLARTCALFGANVVLLGRTRSRLETVFDWISSHTATSPVIVPCDFAGLRDDNVEALHDAIADSMGHLDGLVHNASLLGAMTPIAHYPTSTWESVLRVNTTAPFMLTRGLLPLLEASNRGSIIFTSSGVGRKARAFWGAYAVSKVALEGLVDVLVDELSGTSRILVTSLNPGGTRTAMRAAAYPAEDPQTLPTAEAHMALYLYLLSDSAPSTLQGARLTARDWVGPQV
jgi:NAD(P)-dependent dehydrogenase (short-subunit alcohol dehydrogenase family)